MSRVAGILITLVPYHHPRWEAFTRISGAECHLIELTNRDAFQVLEFSASSSYHRHTLFPNQPTEKITAAALRRRMTAKLEALQPDAVCVSGWAFPASLAALVWAVNHKRPVIMLSESNEFDEPRSALKEFIKEKVVALTSSGLAGGTPQRAYLRKLGLPPDRIFLGYDVVNNDYFSQKASEIRRLRNGTAPDGGNGQGAETVNSGDPCIPASPFFLASARFGGKKNLVRLVEAYASYRRHARKHAPVWELVIAGDGEQRPQIEAAISRCGVAKFVHLAGARSYSDVPLFYALASVFIHASTTEQWGLVVNEAMASGLPVLVSRRCGCAADLVKESRNGFTFDPYATADLTRLMLQMASGQCDLAAMGQASQKIIAEWSPMRFAEGLSRAITTALSNPVPAPAWFDRALLQALLRR